MNTISLHPPGKLISSQEVKVEEIGNIKFTFDRSTTPLLPLADAIYNAQEKKLNCCIVGFIDSTIPSPVFTVYQHNAISDDGTPIVQLFIQYGAKETQALSFLAYQVSFEIDTVFLPDNVTLDYLDQIQVFLWDSDPIASRGTITNVQRN